MLKLTLPSNGNSTKYLAAATHPDVLNRLRRRSQRTPSGCVEWQGAQTNGYGVLTVNKQLVYAHRLSYWMAYGPIPDDLVVDHICSNRRCINVLHLRLLTNSANSSRQPRTDKRSCEHGHPLSGDNLRVHLDSAGRPHRNCRQCGIDRSIAFRAKEPAA